MTAGAGTDIVAVARIARLVDGRGQPFLARWFTAAEIDYCNAKAKPSLHFAARLAAKEAVLKALPARWDGPIPWHDIEITKDASGAPSVRLSGPIGEFAAAAGVGAIRISLSHGDEYATAVAVADLA